jgi:hypothetical protein
MQLIKLPICISIIDTQTSIYKRKRVDTIQNKYAIENNALKESTIICDTSHYKKPSNIKDNSDNSNIN